MIQGILKSRRDLMLISLCSGPDFSIPVPNSQLSHSLPHQTHSNINPYCLHHPNWFCSTGAVGLLPLPCLLQMPCISIHSLKQQYINQKVGGKQGLEIAFCNFKTTERFLLLLLLKKKKGEREWEIKWKKPETYLAFRPGLWCVLHFLSILLHTYGGEEGVEERENKSYKKCNWWQRGPNVCTRSRHSPKCNPCLSIWWE